jgi:NADH-quinone oxidoreductase subunit H
MGIMQRRRGPNVVGFFGILQPFADGIKLLLKEPVFPYQSDLLLFIIAPLLTFMISLVNWVVVPLTASNVVLDLNVSVLFILGSSSLGVYGILLAGWASNSKYAFFGSIRSAAQMISYEVAMSLAIFPVVCLAQSFSLRDILFTQQYIWLIFPLFPSAICFYISILAETNRSPFDLPEAEGELVAGYNVEYSAFFFAFFYLAEYLNILLLSTIFVIFFLGGGSFFFIIDSSAIFAIKIFILIYSIIWVRATLPRYRYDQLMMIGWKILLPITTGYALFVSSFFFFFNHVFLLYI